MKMIHLTFNNAGYFPQCRNTPKNYQYSEKDGKYVHAEVGSQNFAEPVTVNIVANVLRALAGDVPVPTLKPNDIERNPIYEEIASKSYVKYDNPMVDEKGRPALMESLNLNKSHVIDANNKLTQTFILFDGSKLIVNGCYNWHYFDETFTDDGNFKEALLKFIEDIVEVENIRLYSFGNMITMLSRYWNTSDFDSKVEKFLFDNKCTVTMFNTPWCYMLFHCVYKKGKVVHPPKNEKGEEYRAGSNAAWNFKTPLLYTKGIGQVKHIDGDIYCPASDALMECIKNNTGTATILDGGLIYIIGIENCDEEWLEMEGFHRILTREQALTA